jgi:DNA repair protein RadC
MPAFPHQTHFDFFPNLPRRAIRPTKNALGGFDARSLVAPFKFSETPYEYKVVPLRECVSPLDRQLCDTPESVVKYWRANLPGNPYYDPERECLAAIMVNARRRVKGHYLVSIGLLDSVHVAPREIFRLAVLTSAHAIILAHSHPSGDASPSEADIRVTRELIRAGQVLKIELLDHIVIGQPGYQSLKELGYFF